MTLQEQRLLDEVKDLPEEVFPNLLQIVRLFKEGVLRMQQESFQFKSELAEWDKLSDEALLRFEQGL